MNSTAGTTVPRTIMAVGAHADDIEIHLGGTLWKYRQLGYEIVYVMATNNMSGNIQIANARGDHDIVSAPPIPMMERRKRECAAAAEALGAALVHLDHPQRHYTGGDGKERCELRYGAPLPEGIEQDVPSILTAAESAPSVNSLAGLIRKYDPECLFTHGIAQANIEHFATALLVTKAFWKAVDDGFEGAFLQWREAHTLHGEFNCRWETHVDYSKTLEEKMHLIGWHASQMPNALAPDFGHRRLAEWFGKACGCGAAEVFTWVRRPLRRDSTGPVYGELSLELLQNSR